MSSHVRMVFAGIVLILFIAPMYGQQVVFTGGGGADRFTAANPAASLVSAGPSGAVFHTIEGYSLVTGPEVTYFDGQKWQVVKPQIARDAAGGYTQTGAPAKVELQAKGATVSLRVTEIASILDLPLTGLSYTSGRDFTFQNSGATWRLRIVPRGHEFETTVPARQGAKTYSFPYTPTGKTPTVDAKGNLLVGGDLKTSRAVMAGADKKSYLGGAWTV